ncbi:Extracellular solute-binding protein, family 7 [Spirochaeta thermophila DSM 6578]|uniref:Extracellular solute-binding protein, family 7 n=1 Tax=Winmispira thermophila (strain ATCC 700085 / DSM 6578 / Z-1203) TaxID=869211 RepID=G0GEZ5_WINT7|nr:TRAP transporter substrate-binding protein DctP [Spirochaeta thermophila]AEJ62339.1 Extracellular solute-binding protein, family 7 [Spirochaeta thermophila DSM 6578]
MRHLVKLFFLFLGIPLWALTIKVASLAPVGTPWDEALREVAQKWAELSNGEVEMKIYPGGIAGDEIDVIRKMRLGQLQGAVLTSVGLNKIHPDMITMALPMIAQSDEEVSYLLEKMGPRWEGLLVQKGFVPVVWQVAGWVNFFTKVPAYTPDELKKLKLRTYPDEPEMNQTFKEFGFHIVPLTQNEVLAGLQTGIVEAVYAPPVLVATLQWFALAPHYTTLKFAPVVGALVIEERTWNRIPERYRDPFRRAAAEAAEALNDKVKEVDEKALSIMKQHGLVIHEATQEEIAQWEAISREGLARLAGTLFSRDIYEQVIHHIEDYRAGHEDR